MAHIEGAFGQINERLGNFERSVDSRFNQVDVRFNQVDERFNQIEARFNHMDTRFNWLIGTMAGGFFTLIGVQITTILTLLPRH